MSHDPRAVRWAAAAAVLAAAWLCSACPARDAESQEPARGALTLGCTTSIRDSGLLDVLLPRFEAASGIRVRAVAVGTGQALRLGERGDVDALLVHDTESEERFVREGHGVLRREVMTNDFVLVGPRADPAGLRGVASAAEALRRLPASDALFLSRGDDSGTHKAEARLFRAAGLDPARALGPRYRETGSGMGALLHVAVEQDAHALSDRATWLFFENRGHLEILLEGDPALRNVYGVLVVNPARHPHVDAAAAHAFADWLVSPEGREVIAAFRVRGIPVFSPTAR